MLDQNRPMNGRQIKSVSSSKGKKNLLRAHNRTATECEVYQTIVQVNHRAFIGTFQQHVCVRGTYVVRAFVEAHFQKPRNFSIQRL